MDAEAEIETPEEPSPQASSCLTWVGLGVTLVGVLISVLALAAGGGIVALLAKAGGAPGGGGDELGKVFLKIGGWLKFGGSLVWIGTGISVFAFGRGVAIERRLRRSVWSVVGCFSLALGIGCTLLSIPIVWFLQRAFR